MTDIEHTLLYLRESLANYTENELAQAIYRKIEQGSYADEAAFVKDLDDRESAYLDAVLGREIDYARNTQDNKRLIQLNEVYEQLF